MNLYVVRHGQTDYNVQKLFLGHIDIPLNAVGIEQAKETAEKFKSINVDVILVSPLTRAIQTAEYIGKVTGIKPEIEERLIERCYGDMEGHSNRPDWNIQMMLDYNKNYAKENVEPIQSMFQRIYSFLDEITQKYKDKSIVLVTHGGVSHAIESYFNGLPEIPDFDHFEPRALKNCEVRKYMSRKINRCQQDEER